MTKLLFALLSLSLLICNSNALYKNQVGQYDWDIRTIGDIDRIKFLQTRSSFITKDGFIGTLQNSNGKVDWSKDLSSTTSFTELTSQGFVVVEAESSTISTYDYVSGLRLSSNKLSDIDSSETIIDVHIDAVEAQRFLAVAVLTDKHAYLFKDTTLQHKHTLNETWINIRTSGAAGLLYGVSNTRTAGVCVHLVDPTSQARRSPKCASETGNNIQITIYDDVVIVRGPSSATVLPFNGNNNKQALTLGAKATVEYLDECNVLAVDQQNQVKLSTVDANQGTVKEVASLSTSGPSRSSCGADSQQLVVVTEVSESRIKSRKVDLENPTAAPKVLFDQTASFRVGSLDEVYSAKLDSDDFKILLKTENLQLALLAKDNKVVWKNEDSLSQIKEIQYFDYESLEEKEINPYFEHLDEHNDRISDLIPNLIRRLQAQSKKLTQFINLAIHAISTRNYHLLWETRSKFDQRNGLQKIIIAATARNTVVGLDSRTGDILWQSIFDQQWQVEKLYKSKRHHSVKEALVYLKNTNSNRIKLVHINPLNGIISSEEELNRVPQELIHIDLKKSSVCLLTYQDGTAEFYPKAFDRKEAAEVVDNLHVYRFQSKTITGYQVIGDKLFQSWNLHLQDKEEILKTSQWSYDADETSFKTVIADDRKVVYKFSDSNNFALLTKSEFDRPHLNLYIINAVTGRVLDSRSQYEVDFEQPINLLYDENAVFVSFFGTKSLQNEIWVTELYKSELETSFTNLLERYFFGSLQKDEEARYSNADPGFIVFTQKYYFPPGVRSFGAIETIHGVARKNLIIITTNNQIYSLDRGLLSTRRQIVAPGKTVECDSTSFGSCELPGYAPVLPINTQNYLTYFKNYVGLKHVDASPTRFESSSLVLIYGHDVAYATVAPEKRFDMLSEDFRYELLVGSIVLITVGLIVVKGLTRKYKLYKMFSG